MTFFAQIEIDQIEMQKNHTMNNNVNLFLKINKFNTSFEKLFINKLVPILSFHKDIVARPIRLRYLLMKN